MPDTIEPPPVDTEEERQRKIAEAEFEMRKAEEEARLAGLRSSGVTPPGGKIWMGANITRPQFESLPQGARIMPPAPPGGTAPSMLQQLQAADQPGTRTTSVRPFTPSYTSADPTEQRFAANESIRRAVEGGMSQADALAQFGGGLFALPKPAPPPKPILLGSGGVATMNPDGSLKILRPPTPKFVPPKDDPAIKQLVAIALRMAEEERKVQTSLLTAQNLARNPDLTDPDKKTLADDIRGFGSKIEALRKQRADILPQIEALKSGGELEAGAAAGLTAPQTSFQPPAGSRAGKPQVGEVRKGYRFTGGNPADKSNWKKVNE